MKRSAFRAFFVAAALLLAGCAGAGVPAPTSQPAAGTEALTARSTASGVIYIAFEQANVIEIYSQQGTDQSPTGEITTGVNEPFGLYVDHARNLYVSNYGNGTVTIYPFGATKPAATLIGLHQPSQVAVDPAHGKIYAVQLGLPKIFVYKYPCTSHKCNPIGQLTSQESNGNVEDAVDDAGDLFVDGYSDNVEEFTYPPSSPTLLQVSFAFPGGLTIDKHRNLIVCAEPYESQDYNQITSYAPPYNSSSMNWTFSVGGLITGCALSKNDRGIWGSQVYPPSHTDGADGEEFSTVSNPPGQLIDNTDQLLNQPADGIAISPPSDD